MGVPKFYRWVSKAYFLFKAAHSFVPRDIRCYAYLVLEFRF
jgi:hypothetical protein